MNDFVKSQILGFLHISPWSVTNCEAAYRFKRHYKSVHDEQH